MKEKLRDGILFWRRRQKQIPGHITDQMIALREQEWVCGYFLSLTKANSINKDFKNQQLILHFFLQCFISSYMRPLQQVRPKYCIALSCLLYALCLCMCVSMCAHGHMETLRYAFHSMLVESEDNFRESDFFSSPIWLPAIELWFSGLVSTPLYDILSGYLDHYNIF